MSSGFFNVKSFLSRWESRSVSPASTEARMEVEEEDPGASAAAARGLGATASVLLPPDHVNTD
jgi:hypothetical protein